MNKKTIIISIAVIFLSLAYLSYAITESSSAYPKITVKFSKSNPSIVFVNNNDIHINLTDSRGNQYSMHYINATPGTIGSVFQLTTDQPLINGNYTLSIRVSDIMGNMINTTQILIVDVPYMGIAMNIPPLSVSPRKVFDISIKTAENAFGCRYATSPLTGYDDTLFFFDGEDFADVPDNTLIHTKTNFDNASSFSGFNLVEEEETPMYVYCRDNATTRYNPKILYISHDTTPPKISAAADPVIVTDKIGGKVFTNARVSSDDRAVCRYSDVIFDSSSDSYVSTESGFTQMTNYFGNPEDENNESIYSQNPTTTIDVTSLVPNISKIYRFRINISCINRATFNLAGYGPERVSAPITLDFSVNLISPITIVKMSPADFQTNGIIFLNFTTNKISSCTFSFNGTNGSLGTADNKVHSKLLAGDFAQGTYPLKISCTAEGASAVNTYNIVIDKTPPSAPTIVSPNATCTDQVSAALSANDSESGIAGFNYTIIGPGINASPQFTSSSSVTASRMNLSNDSTYYFTANAINGAGLAGPSSQGNSIRYDQTGILCDSRPPSVFLRQNTTTLGVFVTFICLDSETYCNNNSYMYSVSLDSRCTGIMQQMIYNSDRQTFGALVSQAGYFCYQASDIAGNKITGSEKILFQSSSNCYDNIVDGGETDVDCGGSSTCVRCDAGKQCLQNFDCISNYCEAGTCAQPLCNDSIKNGFESDVDCGGISCGKCILNQTCNFNTDCQSNYCNALGKCDAASCRDNITNGNETDVDCGGGVCQKCAAGKFCLSDSDCLSSSCFSGKCFQEPINATEQKPAAVTGNVLSQILKILFLMIGVLGAGGGGGYLYYKKHQPKKPSAATAARAAAPEFKPTAEKPRELTTSEKIKKMTVQEQMKREKEEREKKRESLFGVFGAPGKITPPVPKEIPKKEAKPILAPARRIIIPAKPAEKVSPFERLSKIGAKKEDIFERLSKLKGETEFEKLERVGKGKKAEDIEKPRRKKK